MAKKSTSFQPWDVASKFLKAIAILSAIISTFGYVAGRYQKAATEPIGGWTYHRTVPEPGSGNQTGGPGQTIIQFEVRNPGPGELDNIHLEIDVPDKYDDSTKMFTSGLIYSVGTRTEGDCKWNGDHATLKIMPTVGKDDGKMCKDDCFSVEFVSKEFEWTPSEASVHVEGKRPIDVLHRLVPPERSMFVEWLVWTTLPALFFCVVTILILHGLLWRRVHDEVSRQVADKSTEIKAQAFYEYSQTLRAAQLNQEAVKKITEGAAAPAPAAGEEDQPDESDVSGGEIPG